VQRYNKIVLLRAAEKSLFSENYYLFQKVVYIEIVLRFKEWFNDKYL